MANCVGQRIAWCRIVEWVKELDSVSIGQLRLAFIQDGHSAISNYPLDKVFKDIFGGYLVEC